MATILLVDHHDSVRRATALRLERAGHDVEPHADGSDLLRRCRARPFDVLILDAVVARRYGLDTIEADAVLPPVTILTLSGRDHRADRVQSIAASLNAQSVFVKPYECRRLCRTIQTALASSTPSRSPRRPHAKPRRRSRP